MQIGSPTSSQEVPLRVLEFPSVSVSACSDSKCAKITLTFNVFMGSKSETKRKKYRRNIHDIKLWTNTAEDLGRSYERKSALKVQSRKYIHSRSDALKAIGISNFQCLNRIA